MSRGRRMCGDVQGWARTEHEPKSTMIEAERERGASGSKVDWALTVVGW